MEKNDQGEKELINGYERKQMNLYGLMRMFKHVFFDEFMSVTSSSVNRFAHDYIAVPYSINSLYRCTFLFQRIEELFEIYIRTFDYDFNDFPVVIKLFQVTVDSINSFNARKFFSKG